MFKLTSTGVFYQDKDISVKNSDITGTSYIYNGGTLSSTEVLMLLSFPSPDLPPPPRSAAIPYRHADRDGLARALVNSPEPLTIKGASMNNEECAQLARRQRTMADAELARIPNAQRQAIAAIVNSNPDYDNAASNGLEITPDELDEEVIDQGATMMRDGIIYSHRTLRPAERRAQVKTRQFYGIESILLDENGRRRNKDGSSRRPRRVRAKNRK